MGVQEGRAFRFRLDRVHQAAAGPGRGSLEGMQQVRHGTSCLPSLLLQSVRSCSLAVACRNSPRPTNSQAAAGGTGSSGSRHAAPLLSTGVSDTTAPTGLPLPREHGILT